MLNGMAGTGDSTQMHRVREWGTPEAQSQKQGVAKVPGCEHEGDNSGITGYPSTHSPYDSFHHSLNLIY